MKNVLTFLKSPAIISLILTFPLMIMELVNRRNFGEGFPVLLFGLLWLLPVVFIVLLIPIVRNRQAVLVNPIQLFMRVAGLVLLASLWISILMDQFPCFMGVPNCD